MAQNFRDMLSNRKFAIPLIALLAVCFIGLLLLGVVLILPGLRGDDTRTVAQETTAQATVEATATENAVTATTEPTDAPTAKPSATLVPVGTAIESAGTEATTSSENGDAGAPVSSGAGEGTAVAESTKVAEGQATEEPTPEGGYGDQPTATATTVIEDEELAETGVGWGLILFSGVGLVLVLFAARRLRMATG